MYMYYKTMTKKENTMNPLTSLTSTMAELDLRSCLISQRGQLAFEYYRNQHTATEIAKINSCTKSILSSLICIAMDQGQLPKPDTAITEFFPQLITDKDARKQEITLHHLLTMSAGFNWTEFGGQNSFPHMTRSAHWVDFVLEQSLAHLPGTKMEYNSGISQLLSAILVQATGMTTARFAERYLFGPLGIEAYKWEVDPQGIHTGGFGLWLRPSDMLKFGQLFLQQGTWDNQQLISRRLVAQSAEPFITVEAPYRGSYGWHWWTDSYTDSSDMLSASTTPYFYARGYGGQYVYVIPSLHIVVVLSDDKRKKKHVSADVFREIIAPLLVMQ
ncbi:beta-lactam binding protein AmpH [compost metagenome]